MNKQINHIVALLKAYVFRHDLGEEQDEELRKWAAQEKENQEIINWIDDPKAFGVGLKEMEYLQSRVPAAIKRMEKMLAEDRRKRPSRRKTAWLVAASIVGIIILGSLYFRLEHRVPAANGGQNISAGIGINDIDPGGNKAILTLADGSKITLDSAGKGILARQGSTKVIKLDASQLAYNTNPQKPSLPLYNTISTPKGGQYQVVLPDGTHVWLNAGSSLTFPTTFTDSIRPVMLTGEGYFEVAVNRAAPFTVRTASSTIQVLGTHFDVLAYVEDSMERTTLLTGAVQVSSGARIVLLHPSQQAAIAPTTGLSVRINADTAQAIAWKNGLFNFNEKDLRTVMQEIARWYNVDVAYEGNVPDKVLVGSLHRNTKLSMMLSLLGKIGVRCRMEGRTVFVSP